MPSNISGPVVVNAGSAADPAIRFNGGRTGLYRKAKGIFFSMLGTRTFGWITGGGLVKNGGAVVTFAGTNQTLTVAQVLTGIINGTPTGAAAYTTPTATELDAMIPDVANGDTIEVNIVNTSGGANTITLTGGTGVTVRGNAAVAQNKVGKWLFIRTGAAAWDAWGLPGA